MGDNILDGARVLVIGGAGFIGSHVVEELLKEPVKEVVVYDNFTRGKRENIGQALRDPRCTLFPFGGDIRDLDILHEAFKGIDYVFHLAAMWLLHCKDFPRTAFEVNIAGTFNVLEACVEHGVKRLVYSSSASVYGDAVESPMTEDHPFNNRNFYGATKIAGEAMCTAFHDRFGLPVVGLRYANVYGPNQDQNAAYTGVIPIMLNKIERGEPITVDGDGSQAYDFIYVRDVARANLCALKSGVGLGFYNVGTGVQTSIKELVHLILDLTGASNEITYRPYSPGDARQLVKNRVLSPEKARREIGFEHAFSLRDGLLRLMEWRGLKGCDR